MRMHKSTSALWFRNPDDLRLFGQRSDLGLAVCLFGRFHGCRDAFALATDRLKYSRYRVAKFGATFFDMLLAFNSRVANYLTRLPAGFGSKQDSNANTGASRRARR